MKAFRLVLIPAAAAALFPASALLAETPSSADLAYCRALSDAYVRYIGHDEASPRAIQRRDVSLDGQLAVAQCRQGNARAAIPVLEEKLSAQKFTLPGRS